MYVKVIFIMALLEISYMECSEIRRFIGPSCVYNPSSKLLQQLIKTRGYRTTPASDLPKDDDSPAPDHLDDNQPDAANIEQIEQASNDPVVIVTKDTENNAEEVQSETEAPTLITRIESPIPKSEIENMETFIQNCFDRLSTVEKNVQNCFDRLSNVEKNVQNRFNRFPNGCEMYPPMYYSYNLSGTNTINNYHPPLQGVCFQETGPDGWRIAPVRRRKSIPGYEQNLYGRYQV